MLSFTGNLLQSSFFEALRYRYHQIDTSEKEFGTLKTTYLVEFRLHLAELYLEVGFLVDEFVLEFGVLESRVGQLVLELGHLRVHLLRLQQVLLCLEGEHQEWRVSFEVE